VRNSRADGDVAACQRIGADATPLAAALVTLDVPGRARHSCSPPRIVWPNIRKRGRENTFGAELRDRSPQGCGARSRVGHRHAVGSQRRAGKTLRFEFLVHHRHDGEPALQRTNSRYFRKVRMGQAAQSG
jgi:hypothetical protein